VRLITSILAVGLSFITIGLASPVSAQDGTAQQVVLLPLQGFTVSEDARFGLEQHLREEVNRITGFNIQRRAETIAHIEGMRSMGTECKWDDTSCLIQLGTLAGAKKIVVGTVSKAENTYGVSVVLLDVTDGTREREINDTVSSTREKWPHEMRRVATKLMVPEEVVGAVMVTVKQENATVLVDGIVMGVAPLEEPIQGLLPGRHTVDVQLAGFESFTGFVDVEFGETAIATVDLTPVLDPATVDSLVSADPAAGGAGGEAEIGSSFGTTSWAMVGSASGAVALGAVSLGIAAATYTAAVMRSQTALEDGETASSRYQEGLIWSGAVWTMGAVGTAGLVTGAGLAVATPFIE
jgi:hypothetical protein